MKNLKNKIKKLFIKKQKKLERLPMQVAQEKEDLEVTKSVLDIYCPYCASENFVKRGVRKKKKEVVQLYLCKDCERTFTPGAIKGKHYPMPVILDAISLYHLGYSLEKAATIANDIMNENTKNIIVDKSEKKDNTKTAKICGFEGFTPDESTANHPCNLSIQKNEKAVKYNNILKQAGEFGHEGNQTLAAGVISRADSPEHALAQTQPANSLYHKKLQPSSLANWLKQYKSVCAYARMREFGMKMYKPEDVIISATLAHRQLYRFRYHQAKARMILEEDFRHRKFKCIKEFLELVPAECPHQYFSDEAERASEKPIFFSKTDMIVRSKQNYATKLAEFVLGSVKEPKERHDALQRFMLANDSVTIATEVPIYLRREDLKHMQTQLGFEMYKPRKQKDKKDLEAMSIDELPKLITGHIDFIQIRNGMVHILDYKSRANKEKPLEQLTLYALALSRLTGLRVYNFKCAWFDEKEYFEFFPLHLVYKRKKGRRKKIKTKEGVYNINQNMRKVENLRPIEI